MVEFDELKIMHPGVVVNNKALLPYKTIELNNEGKITVGPSSGSIIQLLNGKGAYEFWLSCTDTSSVLRLGGTKPAGGMPGPFGTSNASINLGDAKGATRCKLSSWDGSLLLSNPDGDISIILKALPRFPAGGGNSLRIIESGTSKDENNQDKFFSRDVIVCSYSNESANLNIGATGGGKPGNIRIRGMDGIDSVIIEGDKGDITLRNADCAEEFDVSPELLQIEPGTVVTLDDDGRLEVSSKEYDRRVAGVISGGGDLKPGIVFDKKKSKSLRVPLAMLGKVFCRVDAEYSPIEVGDILTTSNTPGHAMKAVNSTKSFGAVIGKALKSFSKSKGLIPILIALQ